MSKPVLTKKQKESFENKFRELVTDERAKEAIALWDGTILWDLTDIPHIPGFRKEKLHRELADGYVKLQNQLSNRTI